MKSPVHAIRIISLLLFLCGALYSGAGFAKGSELKFSTAVTAIEQTSATEGVVTVNLFGIEIPLLVNGDTEIETEGDEIGLDGLAVGDFVKIEAFFSDTGITVEEIEVLDSPREQFRFRGTLSSVDTLDGMTAITVLGVEVFTDASTRITRRGISMGNEITVEDLVPGDQVDVRGVLADDGTLLATRIHVGSRQEGKIEIEGEIESVADSSFVVNIRGGGRATVIIDEDTSVSGEVIEGAFVEVEGQLNEVLAILASEVVVDVDGDDDADDDNRRGGDDEDRDRVRQEVEIRLEAVDDGGIRGKAKVEFTEEDDEIEQEFEVEIEDAPLGATFNIVVFFGDTEVDFGTVTIDEDDSVELEFKAKVGEDEDLDEEDEELLSLLPEGTDVRDITAVQIVRDGDVVLEGQL